MKVHHPIPNIVSYLFVFMPVQCAATIVILCIGETHNLINYVSFINYLSYGVTIAGLLYHRWTKPSLYRPIKVAPFACHRSLLPAAPLLSCGGFTLHLFSR